MKVLQIASFDGNIGDVANHNGFRNSLKKSLKQDLDFTNLEMRKFYKNWQELSFDDKFIEYANQFDLIVFGGGGFFELKWDYSQTGTTIDISNEMLSKINPPIIFNCIGTTMVKGVSKNTINKFKKFMDYCITSNKILFTVRNDGSIDVIKELYGDDYSKKVLKVPDGGFFVETKDYQHNEFNKNEKFIAINIASDMPEIRFNGKEGHITKVEFIDTFSEVLNKILNQYLDIRIIFVPHIFKDYELISEVCKHINDKFLRTRISCAPCLNGTQTDGLYNFDIYKNSLLTIGMRYHANVCPIGMNVPTIGICTIDPHIKLYKDIGLSRRCVEANRKGYEDKLEKLINEAICNPHKYQEENKKVMEINNHNNNEYHKIIREFLNQNGLNIGGENNQ